MAKSSCPVSRETFAAKAPKLVADLRPKGMSVEDSPISPMYLSPRKFSTGSLGWYASEKREVEIDGKLCEVQIGFTVTLIGSKELPQGQSVAAA